MPYFEKSDIEKAKQLDLLTYLQTYEPDELVSLGHGVYSTKTHDSLKISHGKWCWWSKGVGGRNALNYLIKVKGYTFPQAVERILGRVASIPPAPVLPAPKQEPQNRELRLPPKSIRQAEAYHYLIKRGISDKVLLECFQAGRIAGITLNGRSVVAFIGLDEKGIPRYAAMRGIGSDLIRDASGSDKRYAFSLPARQKNAVLHVFEGAVDALSYATLMEIAGRDFHAHHLLSLGGIFQKRFDDSTAKLPVALEEYLRREPGIKSVHLHLDNDEKGREAADMIFSLLSDSYDVQDCPPPEGKDCNDCLCLRKGLSLTAKRKKPERTR